MIWGQRWDNVLYGYSIKLVIYINIFCTVIYKYKYLIYPNKCICVYIFHKIILTISFEHIDYEN